MRFIYVTLAIIVLFVYPMGCSGGGSDATLPTNVPDAIALSSCGYPNHLLWGIWNIGFDLVSLSADIEPIRDAEQHFNLTEFLLPPNCSDCFKISVVSFDSETRILDADVTLRNPYNLSGYDVRGILYTNDYGHELLNPDDWTKLFDIPGGDLLNPFKSFAKTETNRVFAGEAEHTEKFLLYIPKPPQYYAIRFAVDASYPGNCREPYEIKNFWQDNIYDDIGSSGQIRIDVYDWQDDISAVTLVAPAITGEDFTQLAPEFGDTWSLNLTNNTGAGAGKHKARFIASSSNSGDLSLYDFAEITISPSGIPDNPVDVTPPWLNHQPKHIVTDGEYIYVAGTYKLQIYDVTDPLEPIWAGFIDSIGYVQDLTVIDGYLLMCYDAEDMRIIDVDPPEEAHFVLSVPAYGYCIGAGDGYAYVAGDDFYIIDVDPIESACVVNTVDIYYSYDIDVEGGYAYLATDEYIYGLQIIDVDPPESAYVAGTIEDPQKSRIIDVDNGYAYMMNIGSGLAIIDVTNPASPQLVKSLPMTFYDIAVANGYAYAPRDNYLQVVDVDPPEEAHIVQNVTPRPLSATISGDYLYGAALTRGVMIFDISVPGSTYLAGTIQSIYSASKVVLSEGYAYSGTPFTYMKALDVESPEKPVITSFLWGCPNDFDVAGDYLYLAEGSLGPDMGDYGVRIVDISNLEAPIIVGSMKTPDHASLIKASGGYAYLIDYPYNGKVLDVDPPESLKKVGSVGPGYGNDIALKDGYLCVTDWYHRLLRIIDFHDPGSAFQVNTVDTTGKPVGVDVLNGYAYVCDPDAGLLIVDVDPPADAFIDNTIVMPDDAFGVVVSGNYTYVTVGEAGLVIVDISDVDLANIIASLDTPGDACGIDISGNFAYVADGDRGLRIVKLW